MQIIKYKKIYLSLSGICVLLSIIFLLIFGLNLSIDFTGGSITKYIITEDYSEEIENNIKNAFQSEGVEVLSMNKEQNIVIVTTPFIEQQVIQNISQNISYDQASFETIGSVIGGETAKKSLKAIGASLIAILFFIAYAFRNVPKNYSSFKFGISAIIAMIHDVLIIAGIFSLLGYLKGVEIGVLFITAVLTIIGFSINDTIVVFDRIRENLQKDKRKELEEIVNDSVNETLRRSVGTSLMVLFILVSLFIWGGESIRYFVLALIVGVVVGTYSSIFVASPVLIILEKFNYSKYKKKK